jgi:hypothetical protein
MSNAVFGLLLLAGPPIGYWIGGRIFKRWVEPRMEARLQRELKFWRGARAEDR